MSHNDEDERLEAIEEYPEPLTGEETEAIMTRLKEVPDSPEYCVRCSVKHIHQAQDAIEDAIKLHGINPPVVPSDLEPILQKLVPLSESVKVCRQWNIPEEKVPECANLLEKFMDKEMSPEEFGDQLGALTGKKAKVFHGDGEVRIAFESE